MCFICKNVTSLALLKRTKKIQFAHLRHALSSSSSSPSSLCSIHRRLLSSSNLASSSYGGPLGCGGSPAVATSAASSSVACDLPQLPRRIRRPWLLKQSPNLISSSEIRARFLDHFSSSSLSHTVVPSSSVVARDGEGSFFINAGMNQFKSRILGEPGSRFADLKRAASVQRCIRAGGRRHNDLESAGRDGSHHTFFEMLGNWSFGDYWKRDACQMAWKFLTETMKLPASQLYITYFGGCPELGLPADSETRDIWLSLGVSDQRLLPFGIEHNFWEMGDTGPCGVSTEIHFDHVGGRCARCFVNTSAPDVVELWNLVFMDKLRPNIGSGELSSLAMRTVDTGMGLERLAALVQGVTSAYDTDLFTPLFASLATNSGGPAYSGAVSPNQPSYRLDTSLRIVADHARSLAVAIGDGLRPGARGSEHKLRQLATRAALHAAYRLRLKPGSLARLAPLIGESLASAHPELANMIAKNAPCLLLEEEAAILAGLPLDRLTPAVLAEACSSPERLVDFLTTPGGRCSLDVVAFFAELHSVPLSAGVLAAAKDLLIRNQTGQRDSFVANAASSLRLIADQISVTDVEARHQFTRFDDRSYEFPPVTARIIGLAVQDNKLSPPRLVDSAELRQASTVAKATGESQTADRQLYLVLDKTNFYCEAGGQLSDMATLSVAGQPALDIAEAIEVAGRVFHRVSFPTANQTSSGSEPIKQHQHQQQSSEIGWSAKLGSEVTLSLNADRRLGLMRHHTATHALSAAIVKLRPDAVQRSSCVRPDELTLSFSINDKDLSEADLATIEADCHRFIKEDLPVGIKWMSLEKADSLPGIRRLPNTDYADKVRVVSFLSDANNAECHQGELCCGTHLARTGDLLDIVIVSSVSNGRGQRELRAIAGPQAVEIRRRSDDLLAASTSSTISAAEIRRQLGGPQPLSRLHRAAIERALDNDIASRSDVHSAVARQILAGILLRLSSVSSSTTTSRVVRYTVESADPMKIGSKRALLKSIGTASDQLFSEQCQFLAMNLGDRTMVITNETNSAQLQSRVRALQSGSNPAAELKLRHGLALCEFPTSSAQLADLLKSLEQS